MLTPIELTNKPLSIKELQSYYYNWDSKIDLRKGPVILDEERDQSEIEYVVLTAGFPHKMSLVAPPILLQTRRKLQKISDAPFLVRDDESRSTRAFIDSQSTYVNCLLTTIRNRIDNQYYG